MDDPTFIAAYAAKETQRLNERLREMLLKGVAPSEEEQKDLVADMDATLARLKSALSQITPEMLEEDDEAEKELN